MNNFSIHALAVAVSLAFSAGALAQAMSKDDYKAGKDKIAAEYKSAKAGCSSMKGNAEDICKAEAKGKEKVAKAELEARYKPSSKNTYDAAVAKAKADEEVAEEKCDDMKGGEKRACKKDAKATEKRLIAEAKAARKSAK